MKQRESAGARAGYPRVAMVAPSLEILGGQGVQADSLVRALRAEGVEVTFVPVNPRFPAGLRWVRRVPLLRTLLNQCLYLVELLALRKVDVVHVFSASYWSFLLAPVPAMLAGRLFGKYVVLNYHSGEADDHLTNWGVLVHPWLRCADVIAVPSDYLKDIFARHGHVAHVIRNFIDASAFRFRERTPLQPRLLSNRNLEPHYGVFTTLAAFVLIRKEVPTATLTIAGYGSQLGALRTTIREQGIEGVTVLGRVEPEHMPALFDQADIFLNASLVDNQPISILEAFAAGLPVVTTPTGDIAAMVQHGKGGTLVPANDAQALADAVVALLRDGARAALLARSARAFVQDFTWDRVCEAWTGLYYGCESAAATNT